MNDLAALLLGWLLRASWQAACLAILVLGVTRAFPVKLAPRWRHALWLLVLARLLLPYWPSSPFSLFNFVPAEVGFAGIRNPPNGNSIPSESAFPGGKWFQNVPVTELILLIWALGAAISTLRILRQNRAFRRGLGQPGPVKDAATLALFDRCKAESGVTARIPLLESPAVQMPALQGTGGLKLLLPAGLAERFCAAELRHIFLHELAHVRRRDLAVLRLATLAGILHWFNPVVGLAIRRLAEDREMACDEAALALAGGGENCRYGETILKLLESHPRHAAVPALMGIMEDMPPMRRRILMIARFKPRPRRPAFVGLFLLAAATVALTDPLPAGRRAGFAGNTPTVTRTRTALAKSVIAPTTARPLTNADVAAGQIKSDPEAVPGRNGLEATRGLIERSLKQAQEIITRVCGISAGFDSDAAPDNPWED